MAELTQSYVQGASALPLDYRTLGAMFRTLTYRQKYELLQAQSARDPMTRLYNRGFFDAELDMQIVSSLRAQTSLAILRVDVDHFKRVNDTHGHIEGDRVLAAGDKAGNAAGLSRYSVSPIGMRGWRTSDPAGAAMALTHELRAEESAFHA